MKFVLKTTYTLYTTHLKPNSLGVKTSLLRNRTFQCEVLYVLVIRNCPIFYLAVRVMTQLLTEKGKLCPINSHFVDLPDYFWLMFFTHPVDSLKLSDVLIVYIQSREVRKQNLTYITTRMLISLFPAYLYFLKSHIFIS